jgi:acid stress chaperone HdeB
LCATAGRCGYRKRIIRSANAAHTESRLKSSNKGELKMNSLKLLISSAAFVLAINSVTQAQMSVDMTKVTCEQLTQGPPESELLLATWLSGYYNGKLNRTKWDLNKFKQNADIVIEYCQKNPKKSVMQAVAAVQSKLK